MPGRPPNALKHRLVSSTRTGPLTNFDARRHFSIDTSIGSPCNSGRSNFIETSSNGKLSPRIATTSSNLNNRYGVWSMDYGIVDLQLGYYLL